jgi:hypothetical protein
MGVVDENRLKGNFGALHVSSLLANDCLIRPVAADTDVGIDLYCETLADRSVPFLHFWIQAKTGKQCRIVEDGDRASCAFEVEDLQYWRRQPVPVYAALVPDEENPPVFVVDITRQPPSAKERDQKEVTLRSDFVWRHDRAAVQDFLSTVVPYDTALLSLRLGTFAKIPTPRPVYEIGFPMVPIEPFLQLIVEQVRTTAASSVLCLRKSRGLDHDILARRKLAAILEQYCTCEKRYRDPHWETYMALALSYHSDRRFDEAIAQYDIAKHAIENDPNLDRSNPPWSIYLERMNENIERAGKGEMLSA